VEDFLHLDVLVEGDDREVLGVDASVPQVLSDDPVQQPLVRGANPVGSSGEARVEEPDEPSKRVQRPLAETRVEDVWVYLAHHTLERVVVWTRDVGVVGLKHVAAYAPHERRARQKSLSEEPLIKRRAILMGSRRDVGECRPGPKEKNDLQPSALELTIDKRHFGGMDTTRGSDVT
jgi:hypothetical protein